MHPPKHLRPYCVFGTGLAAAMAVGGTAACIIGLSSRDPSDGILGAAAFVCMSVAAGTLALGLARVSWVLHGGPEAARRFMGADALLTSSLLLTGSGASGFALNMLSKQLAGVGRAPDLMVYSLSAIVGALGIALFFGFGLRLGNRLFRGPTKFVQEEGSVAPGGVLCGRLEVPFAPERALELEVLLELIHSRPGPNPDDPREQAVVFAASVRTVASLPLGRRRAGARIEIPLEFEPPPASDDPTIAWFCHMEVNPANRDVAWNALIEPRIDWKG